MIEASDQILKTCPDCNREYLGLAEDNCCASCFENFEGLTVDEIMECTNNSASSNT